MNRVIIEGFSSPEMAKTFMDWFEGQGEQDSQFWFAEHALMNKTILTDMENYSQDPNQDGDFVLTIKEIP